ncbi:hypothetical protein AB0D97_14285 [Streptomyces roseus]|uniref:hypothetical protein n=1 Tax=Streptomyces roseus TaxID=66430 RepID=UPI0033CCE7DC
MSYNVFVDDRTTGQNRATFNTVEAYDASALANHFVDAGFCVETDLWGAVVPDAMMSPEVVALAESTLPVFARI